MMRWLLTILAVLGLTLPCQSQVEVAWNEADSGLVTRVSSENRDYWMAPWTNRSTNASLVEIEADKYVEIPPYVPRYQTVQVVGVPGAVIYDTADNTAIGALNNPAVALIGVDDVRDQLIGYVASTYKLYIGTIGAAAVTWAELYDCSTVGSIFQNADYGIGTGGVSRQAYAATVVGDRLCVYFGNQGTAQPALPAAYADHLARVYTTTWNGAAYSTSWTHAMSSEYGPPALPASVGVSGNCLAWGTYNSLANTERVGYYFSDDGGATWTAVDVIRRTNDDDQGFKIHCHGCVFGEDATEFYAGHGDGTGLIRRFYKSGGTWSTEDCSTGQQTLSTTVDGIVDNSTTINLTDTFNSTSILGGRVVVAGVANTINSDPAGQDYNTIIVTTAVTMAGGEVVTATTPTAIGPTVMAYHNRKLYGTKHNSFGIWGNIATVFSWDRDSELIEQWLEIPSYVAAFDFTDDYGPYDYRMAYGAGAECCKIDGLLYAATYSAMNYGGEIARYGSGLYVSGDGEHWTQLFRHNHEAAADAVRPAGVRIVGGVGDYIALYGIRMVTAGAVLQSRYTILVPKPTVRTVDAFVVHKGGMNVWGSGWAVHDYCGSFETDTLENAGWYAAGSQCELSGTCSLAPSTGDALEGSKALAWTVETGCTDNGSGTGVNRYATGYAYKRYNAVLEPENAEKVSIQFWHRGAPVADEMRRQVGLDTAATADTELRKPGGDWMRYVGGNWYPYTITYEGEADWADDDPYRLWIKVHQNWEAVASTVYMDLFTCVVDPYRWYTYSLMPARTGNPNVTRGVVTFEADDDTVTWTGHGLSDGNLVSFNGGTFPTGLDDDMFWVTVASANTFTLWTDKARTSQATFTSDGSGTIYCNVMDRLAAWSDEIVVLPMPSATASWSVTLDWLPREPAANFIENIPIATLRGVTGAYAEIGWVDLTDGANPGKIYITDGTTTKYAATVVSFLHWDDIKIALSVTAGIPTTFAVWDPRNGWQATDVSDGTDLLSLGVCHSIELGSNASHAASAGNYAAVGCGRFANIRLHTGALGEAVIEATAMVTAPQYGTGQRKAGGQGLYINPPVR